MVDFGNLMVFQGTIFLLIAIGFLLGKLHLVEESGKQALNNLLIYVVLPCNIIHSFIDNEAGLSVISACFTILLFSLFNQAFSVLIGKKIYPMAKANELPVLAYGTLCSNAGFIGMPMAEGIYGAAGLLYASVFLIPQRISMYSIGMNYYTRVSGKDVVKKVLTHPCIIAVLLGVVYLFFPFEVPALPHKVITTLSNANLSLSMVVIGVILSECDLSHLFTKVNFYYCFIRLIALPTVMMGVCYLFHAEPIVAGITVVLTGMPAGATTAILASKYGCDEKVGVSIIFLSTVLSILTIPIWCLIVSHLFAV